MTCSKFISALMLIMLCTGCASTQKFTYKQPPLTMIEEHDDSWVIRAPIKDVRTYLKNNLNLADRNTQIRTASNYIEVIIPHTTVVSSIVHLDLSAKDKDLTLIKYNDVTQYSRCFAGVITVATIYATGPYYAVAIPSAKNNTKEMIKKSMHNTLIQSQND